MSLEIIRSANDYQRVASVASVFSSGNTRYGFDARSLARVRKL
jgi:hypothetical protein